VKIADATALVTGANRGIGASLVRELIARGARRVYATARHPEALPKPAALHRDIVVPVALDITDPAQINTAAATAADVTLLVNNAGSHTQGSVLDAHLDDIAYEMAVNFFGTLRMTRAFAPLTGAGRWSTCLAFWR
jgi:NAD(P)-dependent dehydrogenase (short-subunit alcohol dehydrogenase family)